MPETAEKCRGWLRGSWGDGMSDELDVKARALWDACPTAKPEWDQLGDVTKSVWRERAAAGQTPEKLYPFAAASGRVAVQAVSEEGGNAESASEAHPGKCLVPTGKEETKTTTAAELQGSLF